MADMFQYCLLLLKIKPGIKFYHYIYILYYCCPSSHKSDLLIKGTACLHVVSGLAPKRWGQCFEWICSVGAIDLRTVVARLWHFFPLNNDYSIWIYDRFCATGFRVGLGVLLSQPTMLSSRKTNTEPTKLKY